MRIALSFFVIASLTGCPGDAPPNPTGSPDAGGADAEATSFLLSGKVVDYFGAQPIEGAMLSTDGLDPNVMASSAADGAYQLDVAVGSALFLVATKTGYRPTRNQAMSIDMPVTYDAYLMTDQDVRNQYTAVGATPVAGTAFVVAELRRNDGTPLEGIPLANVQLLDAANQPVAGVKGPYFFNAAGSVDTAVLTSVAYQGRVRVAYLDVPPGLSTLSVTYTGGMNQNVTNTTPVTTVADGGTLALSGGTGGGGGGGTNVIDPSFATHIYPKLQRAAAGGLGCANCHTLAGPGAVLKYDDPPGAVLLAMTARLGVINAAVPADSLLLKRPLYEAPPLAQDHPNATFLTTNDTDYKLFLLWITNGAKP